jgi:cytochrome c553
MKRVLLSAAAAAGAMLLLSVLVGAAPRSSAPAPMSPSWRVPVGDPARGEKLAQTCLTCHRDQLGAGDTPVPKLHRQRPSYLFAALLEYRDGRRRSELMEPMAQSLSDQDIRDVVAYLAGDMLAKPPKSHSELPIYQRTSRQCTWCHGESGIGEMEGMPVLTGQDAAYLARALAEYRSGVRSNPIMRGVVEEVPVTEDRALAEYYGSHPWLERNP